MAIGKKTGGRVAGTANKRTYDARALAEKKGVDPLEILLDIASNNWEALGYDKAYITKVNLGIEYEEAVISLEERSRAAKESAKYIYPQLKSIEHTGKDGTDLFAKRLLEAQARVSTLVGDSSEKEVIDEQP
jgi:hypothetical protein